MKKVYIGIDPGITGAIAFINPYDLPEIRICDFEEGAALETLRWLSEYHPCKAIIEKVNSMPGQGVSSTFKFGQNFGQWIGRLEALRIPYDLVHPTKWKKLMFDSHRPDKDASRGRALRIFPQMAEALKRKKDHNRAEALLLAEYARITDK